ncbi:hypothetical protein AB1E18_015559 [Capra hircus]
MRSTDWPQDPCLPMLHQSHSGMKQDKKDRACQNQGDRPYSAETRPAPRLPALRLVCFLNTSVEQERTEPARIKGVCSTLS